MPERNHDPYKSEQKPAGHAACPDCGAVFANGRWQWGTRHASATDERCPACRRIKEHLPAGFVKIDGPFLREHHDELLALVRHHAEHVKAEHALERIIAIEEHPDHVMVTTTDIHLARGLGEALHHAYQGVLNFDYLDAEPLLRVHWTR
jgi:NMD protein affecting ribosome stability and mRNA decay